MWFWGWDLRLGFWGWGFQLMGFGASGVGPSGFLGWDSLNKHKRTILGKNGARVMPLSYFSHHRRRDIIIEYAAGPYAFVYIISDQYG